MSTLRISGTGCALADLLYTNIDFKGESFSRFRSRGSGDGGLVPGNLVFADELERFAGMDIRAILESITKGTRPASRNLGGPAIVALINAAQLLYNRPDIEIEFVGAAGRDENGEYILNTIHDCSIRTDRYKVVSGSSPVTYVLSDPAYSDGQGERTFINDVGAAWELGPEDLGEDFFAGDVILFGATGLVPQLHDRLTELLEHGKELGRISVVTTVYDFRSEKRAPGGRWPLGTSDESYRNIDLLITDREEALRLSASSTPEDAADFFNRQGVGAFIITNGSQSIRFYSRGEVFARTDGELPVSEEVRRRLETFSGEGDTTGCGDNFAGGVIASLALQMQGGHRQNLDLPSACSLGIACGGFTCFYLGGTYHEARRGEKQAKIAPLYEAYRSQVGRQIKLLPFD